MQFFYGGYQHQDKSVAFRGINRALTLGPNGRAFLLNETWQLEGKLIAVNGGGQSEIMSDLAALRVAYSQNGQPCGFAGTPWIMNPTNSVGGPVVTAPISHGEIKGSEGVTYLKYNWSLQNNTLFSDGYPNAADGALIEYQETVSFTNNAGLPIYVERIPQNGLPILQQTTSNSWYFATQSGSATSTNTWPTPEDAMFPGALRTSSNAAANFTYKSPQMIRGVAVSYTTTWKYDYISALPFYSLPHVRG